MKTMKCKSESYDCNSETKYCMLFYDLCGFLIIYFYDLIFILRRFTSV